jgi:hypothetical protein
VRKKNEKLEEGKVGIGFGKSEVPSEACDNRKVGMRMLSREVRILCPKPEAALDKVGREYLASRE